MKRVFMTLLLTLLLVVLLNRLGVAESWSWYSSTQDSEEGFYCIDGSSDAVSMYVANCEQWVSLRKGADVNSARLAQVPKGARVQDCRELDNGFTMCSYQGNTGYILTQFLEDQPGYQRRWIVNCEEWVSLRRGADTSSERIVKVPLGCAVTQCSVLPNGFSYCEYEGLYGYILTKYLAQKPSAGSTMYIGNCEEWVSLREVAAAGSARLMRVPVGEAVTVYRTLANGYALCMYKGVYGHILADYLVTVCNEYDSGWLYVTNCEEWVSLRALPSSTSQRLAKVPLGAAVRWLEVHSNGYTRCLYQGTAGYIRTEYLAPLP